MSVDERAPPCRHRGPDPSVRIGSGSAGAGKGMLIRLGPRAVLPIRLRTVNASISSPAMAAAGGKRRRRKPSQFEGRPSELGTLLTDLRTAKGMSLRQVEEATDRAVSNAYLSQLENGKIKKPSPNVLHSLAGVYAVPYEALMEKAGYLLPAETGKVGRRRRLAIFAIDDLTAEEEEELLKYLAFLRSRNQSS
jgi:HTH-type transcriptional regulator, competence development regulator